MANIKVKNADAEDKYKAATGVGSDVDPYIERVEVEQDTHDDMNVNANMQVGDADVGAGNKVPVDATAAGDVPVTMDGEVVAVDATSQGDVPVTLDGEEVSVKLSPPSSGGYDIHRTIDLDESEEEIKASAGQVYGWFLANEGESTVYIKFYNATATNVTVGTTTPALTIPLGGGKQANVEYVGGIAFDTAICIAATTGLADDDTGAPAANNVVANILYK